jgi:hypothetical protein
MVLNDAGELWNGLSRVEEVDDGLALLHVAQQPDVVELSGFFCLETDNVYIAVYSFYCLYCPFFVIKHRVQLYFLHTVLPVLRLCQPLPGVEVLACPGAARIWCMSSWS